ncbi:MAG: hypothetical protein Q8O10_05955 [candidate division Zixibacteria bacterium]|nr:hypothetical protein [candidate division Zixibacteria bacterium]
MRLVKKLFLLGLLFSVLSFLPISVSESDTEFNLENKANPRFNSITSRIVDDFLVNDDTGSSDQEYPAIATDWSENLVICWQDDRNGNWDIYAQRYNLTGTQQGPNFKINGRYRKCCAVRSWCCYGLLWQLYGYLD